MDDVTFDALYPEPIRALSERFWTPVAVASRAARLLALQDVRRVLDVGSGVGKFCLAAACAHQELDFTGIEHRGHLVEIARAAGTRLGLSNAHFCMGDVTSFSWLDFDGLYLYNPFAENVCDEKECVDGGVELSTSRFMIDVRRVVRALRAAQVGTCMVTYHGFGGPIPASYQLAHAERAGSNWLRLWVKRREQRDCQGFYVEDVDDVLCVSTRSDVPCSWKECTCRGHAAETPKIVTVMRAPATDPKDERPSLQRR